MTERLSDILQKTFDPNAGKKSFGELIDELEHHGMAVVLILFALPAALPIPAAGYSTLLSLPLMLIGLRITAGYETIWLPEKMRAKTFETKSFKKLLPPMMKLSKLIERFAKPRMLKYIHAKSTMVLIGLLICLMACSMMLPVPGTNTLPAGGVFLIGFALLESDGLLLLIGKVYSLFAVAVSVCVILFGYEVVKMAIKGIWS